MKQITIASRDYDGLTADIATVLADNDINIESLDAEAVDGVGLVTLTVDHYNRALHALRDAGWSAVTEDALVLRVPDEPGALARVAKKFKDAGVHVHSIRIIHHEGGNGIIAVNASPPAKAREMVGEQILSDTVR